MPNKILHLQFQLKHVKNLEAITPTPTIRKRLNELKVIDFPWTHQRNEHTRQTASSRYGETDRTRKSKPRTTRSPQIQTSGPIN